MSQHKKRILKKKVGGKTRNRLSSGFFFFFDFANQQTIPKLSLETTQASRLVERKGVLGVQGGVGVVDIKLDHLHLRHQPHHSRRDVRALTRKRALDLLDSRKQPKILRSTICKSHL